MKGKNKVSVKAANAGKPVSKKSIKSISAERKKEDMDRAQIWSIDVLLALVIFVAIIIIFYTTISAKQNPKLKDLQIEAGGLKAELEQHPDLGFIRADTIDADRMNNFTKMVESNYTAVKEELGIRGDFCIFFEDESGNLIPINGKNGIGNTSEIMIDDSNHIPQPCGKLLS
jgi:hypothetical protein